MYQFRILLMCVIFTILPNAIMSQDHSQTYMSYYETFTVSYDDSWQLESDGQNVATFTNIEGTTTVKFYDPKFIARDYDDDLPIEEFFPQLGSKYGIEGEVAYLTLGDMGVVRIGNHDSERVLFAFYTYDIEFGIGMALVTAPNPVSLTIMEFLRGYQFYVLPESPVIIDKGAGQCKRTPSSTTYGCPLVSWQDSQQAIIAELQERGIIGETTELIAEFDRITLTATHPDVWIENLTFDQQYTNVVFGGTIVMDSMDDDVERFVHDKCYLATRFRSITEGQDEILSMTGAGVGSHSFFDLRDTNTWRDGVPVSPFREDVIPVWNKSSVVVVVIEDNITVFGNGVRYAFNFKVPPRIGDFAVMLFASFAGTQCTFTDLWLYEVSHPVQEPCMVKITYSRSKRYLLPSLESDELDQLGTNIPYRAVGRWLDNHTLWWLLKDGGWIRNDEVGIQGDCYSLPVTN